MKSDVFLVGLKLDGRGCLVVGAGEEAERRATALAHAGARVHVVSEHPSPALERLSESGSVSLSARAFTESDLDGAWLAVLTDMDRAVAERMFHAAEARRVFFCAVDQPDLGSFSHVALARSGPVTVAISTNGRAPALARRLREELVRVFDAAGLGAFAERLAALRDRTPSARRKAVLGEAVEGVALSGELRLPAPEK